MSTLPTILVVDDEKDNLEAIQRLLRNQYDLHTTTSPLEALKWVMTHKYHVIVSDQRMPEMTGVELLEKVKKLSPDATRILLTGYTDIESVIEAINRGNIYRYIAKPWEPEDFKLTLKQADEAFLLKRALQEKTEALSEAFDQLKVLDKAKSRFLSLVSHELNTPLTILNSFLALLLEEKDKLSGDVQKSLNAMQGASVRFSEIISEILSYIRLEADATLDRKKTDIKKICQDQIEGLSEWLKKNKIAIKWSADSFMASVDISKMQTAIQKLLWDSIEKAPNGSAIEVVLKQESGDWQFSIARKGDPISEEALNAFETGSSIAHHQRNLGLSLAIAKRIIEMHGGELRVENKETGIRLYFSLPIEG